MDYELQMLTLLGTKTYRYTNEKLDYSTSVKPRIGFTKKEDTPVLIPGLRKAALCLFLERNRRLNVFSKSYKLNNLCS